MSIETLNDDDDDEQKKRKINNQHNSSFDNTAPENYDRYVTRFSYS